MRRAFDLATSNLGSLLRLKTAQHVLKRNGNNIPKCTLTLYEYEASPWCRVVREHLQLLGLPVLIKPCPRQTLFKEGAFDTNAVFRKEAWEIYEQENQNDEKEKEMKMMYQFPLLVDETSSSSSPEIVSESSTIIRHLWEKYSDNVIEERPSVDLKLNSNGLPFFVRFPLLSAPSAVRPFPHCGLFQLPSSFHAPQVNTTSTTKEPLKPLVFRGKEGCPESRLVRERLCSLLIPYYNHPNTREHDTIIQLEDPNGGSSLSLFKTLDDAMAHLDTKYGTATKEQQLLQDGQTGVASSFHISSTPSLLRVFQKIPQTNNLGRSGWFGDAAKSAMTKGSKYFVDPTIGYQTPK